MSFAWQAVDRCCYAYVTHKLQFKLRPICSLIRMSFRRTVTCDVRQQFHFKHHLSSSPAPTNQSQSPPTVAIAKLAERSASAHSPTTNTLVSTTRAITPAVYLALHVPPRGILLRSAVVIGFTSNGTTGRGKWRWKGNGWLEEGGSAV